MNRKLVAIRVCKWLGGVSAVLFLVLILVYGLLQTDPARKNIAELLSEHLSSPPDNRLEVMGIGGSIPFNIRIDRLTLTDAKGQWLITEDVRIRWSPLSLLSGHFRFHEISAGTLQLKRLPIVPEARPKEGIGTMPSWKVLSLVIIEEFNAKHISLEESILGEAASFCIDGKMIPLENSTGLVATLDIRRTEFPLPKGALRLIAKRKPSTFELHSKIEDSSDGLLSSALGFSGAGPLFLRLEGKGPLTEWKGKFIAGTGNYGDMDGGIRLKLDQHVAMATFDGTLKAKGKLTGVINVHANLNREVKTGIISGGFKGQTDRLSGLPPPADVLLGSEIGLAGRFKLAGWTHIMVPELRVDGVAANLSGDATVDLLHKTVKGNCQVSLPRLDLLSSALERKLSGSAQVDGEFMGSLSRMDSIVKATGKRIEIEGMKFDQVTLGLRALGEPKQPQGHIKLELTQERHRLALETDFSLKEHIVLLSNVNLSGPGPLATGSLAMNLDTRLAEGRLQAEFPDLSAFGRFTDKKLAGSITLNAWLVPVNGRQDLKLALEGNTVSADFGEIKEVRVDLDLKDILGQPRGSTQVRVERFLSGELTIDTLSFTAKGDNKRMDFQAEGKGQLNEDFNMQTTGIVVISSEGEAIKFQRLRGKYGEQEITLVGPTEFRRSSDSYVFDPLVLNLGPGQIQASGTLKPDWVDFDGRFKGLPLDLSPHVRELDVSGLASGHIRITGTLESPEIESALSLEDIKLTDPSFKAIQPRSIRADAKFLDGRLNAALTVEGSLEEKVRMTTSIPLHLTLSPIAFSLPTEEKIKGNLEAKTNLTVLSAILRRDGENISGKLTSNIKIGGTLEAPRIKAELRLKDIRLRDPVLQEIQPKSITADARFQDNRLDTTLKIEGSQEDQARARIDLPLDFSVSPLAFSLPRQGKIQGGVDGNINLNTLAAILQLDVENLSGQLTADLHIRGTVDSPEVTGYANIKGGIYENFYTGTVLKEIDIRAVTKDRRINLEKLYATDGEKGIISGKGRIDLDAAKDYPLAMDVSLKEVKLLRRDDLNAVAEGSLSLSGSLKEIRLEGQLALAPVEIYLADTTASEIPQLDIIEINLDKEQTGKMKELAIPAGEESMGNISFDIQATLPNRVFIRGRGLESEYKGILQIAGQADALTITGILSVVRGQVDFLDRRFKVVEGSLTFHGYQPPSPILNLTAEYKTSALRTLLRLTGNISALKIALESDPPLPQEEILSRLLFGKGLDTITPWEAFRISQALRTLSGGQGFNVLGSVRQALKVDQLEVIQGDEDQVAIGVGKYISDEVFVDVQKQVYGEGGKVSVEVQVTPNIAVESEVGTDSKADIGINWGFNY